MGMQTKVGGNWKKIDSGWVKVGNAWKEIESAWVKENGVWKKIYENTLSLVLSSNANNVNIFALAGSPSGPVNLEVTVNSGVVIGSSSVTAAMRIMGFAAGSQITLINSGQILGDGGSGGSGYFAGVTYPLTEAPGAPGGSALEIDSTISIDNIGDIFGGGGGGGAGARTTNRSTQGYGGVGGNGTGFNQSRTDGVQPPRFGARYGATGGKGGNGGNWGAAGQAGALSLGKSGGAAGKAVNTHGNSISWIAGHNSTHVKGAVG